MSFTDGKTGISDTLGQPNDPIPDPAETQGNYLKILRESLAKSAKKPYRSLAVAKLLDHPPNLKISTLAGVEGLGRAIKTPLLFRLGLALAGYDDDLPDGGLVWVGGAEAQWLREHPHQKWKDRPIAWAEKGLAGILMSKDESVPTAFVEAVQNAKLPLLITEHSLAKLLTQMPSIMDRHLSPKICFHGNMLVISGFGVLILGKSGIGKSDDALDLIMHGHQLVADDVVHVYRNPLGKLIGMADELTRHHLTIRGLGIINIKELFGVTAILESHPIDLILYLESWENPRQYDLQKQEELEILGITLPMMRLPVSPGRSLENLITVAVKTHELQTLGFNAEERLSEKLREKLENKPSRD